MRGWHWKFFGYFINLYLLEGAIFTIVLTATTLFLGFCLGLLIALMRLSGRAPLVRFAKFYVWLFRAHPFSCS